MGRCVQGPHLDRGWASCVGTCTGSELNQLPAIRTDATTSTMLGLLREIDSSCIAHRPLSDCQIFSCLGADAAVCTGGRSIGQGARGTSGDPAGCDGRSRWHAPSIAPRGSASYDASDASTRSSCSTVLRATHASTSAVERNPPRVLPSM